MNHRSLAHARTLALLVGLVACTGPAQTQNPPPGPPPPPPAPPETPAPPAASVSVKVTVPQSMRSGPFDRDRFLTVPPGFSASVYARVPGARFMAVAPNGDLLVSQPGAGKIALVRPGTGDPRVLEFASGLRKPHDLVFYTAGGTTYLYVTESHQVSRTVYTPGDAKAQKLVPVVENLPDSSTPDLKGPYGHELKNIALSSDGKLYVSIASASNDDPADLAASPKRGAIYVYNADGSNGQLFAQGIRNAEGLAFAPGTNDLWVVVNNRDNIAYPFNDDWDKDGNTDFGEVIPSYVDNHPPEEFMKVRDGGHYGWPFYNPNPDTASGLNNMPFDRDARNNADGSKLNCETADRVNKGIQAHSAPLGLSFYRSGAVTALHGSWNRTSPAGYKVIYFPWSNGAPGAEQDLVSGWVQGKDYWGRPVDAVVDADGNLFISDDHAGTIYKLSGP